MMILAPPEKKQEIRKSIDRIVKANQPKTCRPRVTKITDLDKILHRSIVKKGTNKYFTTGHNCEARNFLAEGSPYSENFKEQKKEVKTRYMAPTIKWKPKFGLNERLRVETPPLEEGVLDTIPDFYKVVSCRPIKEQFRKRIFAEQMRKRFLKNLQSGFYEDIIKRIDEHDNIARSILQKAVDDSEEAVLGMRLFLSGQINDMRSIETELKTVRSLKTAKEVKMDFALRKMGNLKVDMFKIMEQINEAINCREFLHSLSTDQWKYEYGILKNRFMKQRESEVKELMETFAKYKQYLGGKDPGLEEIMQNFIKIFQEAGPCKIQFKTSNDLALALKNLERENKNALVHIKEIEEPVKKVRGYLTEIEKGSRSDLDFVRGEIQRAEKELIEIRAKNDTLTIMTDDMIGKYKKVIISRSVLEERGLVKAMYDELVENKRLNPTNLEMWEDIEGCFLALKEKMIEIPKDELERRKRIVKERMKREEITAIKAKNRLTQVNQMIASLKRAFEPPMKTMGKALMPRSQPPAPPERTPTPEAAPRYFKYMDQLKLEHSMYTPLAIRYHAPKISPIPEESPVERRSETASTMEKQQKYRSYSRRQSLVPKPKSSHLSMPKEQRKKYDFSEDDDLDYKALFGKRLEIEDPFDPTLKIPDPPKVEIPKYVPKVIEEKKKDDDEDSDY